MLQAKVHSALLGLLALIVLSGVLGWNQDQNYVYKANTVTWSALDRGSRTGFSWEGLLTINWKSVRVMTGRLTHMKSETFEWKEGSIYNNSGLLAVGFTDNPFEVDFIDGLVSELRVSEGTLEWEIELIRSVIGQLQISSTISAKNEFNILEESVAGICETNYSVLSEDNHIMVSGTKDYGMMVTKTKDYAHCTKMPMIRKGVIGKGNSKAVTEPQNIFSMNSNSTIFTTGNYTNYAIKSSETVQEIVVVSQNNETSVRSEISLKLLPNEQTNVSNVDITIEKNLVSVGGLSFHDRSGVDYYLNPVHVSDCVNRPNRELVIELIKKIALNLNTSDAVKFNTLDRYTVLVQLVQQLDEFDLENVYPTMEDANSRDVFLLALINSGTLPAFKQFISLLDTELLESKDSELLVLLTDNAHPLSLEFLDVFYRMIVDVIPRKERVDFEAESSLAFSNMVRRYLTELERPSLPRPVETRLIKGYIPHFVHMLDRALSHKDNNMIHIYIRSLGNLGHPNVISIFQSYLLDDQKELNTYYKTFMISCMDKLIELKPESARRLLHKLFVLPQTEYSVRLAALYQILLSNPSLKFIQDLLIWTRDSSLSDELKDKVKSIVMSSAYPYGSDEKIRALAESIVVPITVSNSASGATGFNTTDGMYGQRLILEVIQGLGDNPHYIRALFKETKQGFMDAPLMLSIMVNNTQREWSMGTLPKLCNVFFEYSFEQYFFPVEDFYTSAAIGRIQQWLSAKDWTAAEHWFDLAVHQILIGFPTETGFPFLYNHETAAMWYLKGPGKATLTSQDSQLAVNFHAAFSLKSHTQVSIANPLDGIHYVAGADRNFQVNVPVSVELSSKKGSDQLLAVKVLTFKPLPSETPQRIFHVSSWPYQSIRCLHPIQPVAEDENTRYILDAFTVLNEKFLDESDGFRIEVKTNKTPTDISEYLAMDDVLFPDMTPFYHVPLHHEVLNVFLGSSNSSLTMSLDLNSETMYAVPDDPVGMTEDLFLFIAQQKFELKINLTGETVHSFSLIGKFAEDIHDVRWLSLKGQYSKNDTVIYKACQDTYIKPNNVTGPVVHGSIRFGKTCQTGSLVALETILGPDFEKNFPNELNFTVYHRELDNGTAITLCRLRDGPSELFAGDNDFKLNFVFHDQNELCDRVLSTAGPVGDES